MDGPFLRRNDTRQAVQLKGVNVAEKRWTEASLTLARSWGVNIFRLILDVRSIREDAALRARLSDTVRRSGELGMYVLFDPHTIGGVEDFALPTDEVVDAMRLLAREYRDAPHVLFGIWNEPHPDARPDLYGSTPEQQWREWMSVAVRIAQAIRDERPDAILVVSGGRAWSRDFRYYQTNPFPFSGIAFDVHDYGPAPNRDWWSWAIGRYPIILGEFGGIGYYDAKRPFNGPDDVAYFRDAIRLVNANPQRMHYIAHHFGGCYRGLDRDTCLLMSQRDNTPSPRGQVVYDDLRTIPPTRFRD